METYLIRRMLRRLPGVIIKAVPLPHPEVYEGLGQRSRVGEICRMRQWKSVLVVTDRTLSGLGYHLPVLEALEKEGITYRLFADIDSEPTTDIVEAGRLAAEACHAEAVVALGGGSVLDSCKMIAAGMRLKKMNVHFLLLKFLFVPRQTLPLVNIPSTAGTGAELTVGAMITDTVLKVKSSTVVVGLQVTDVILDSELTLRAPQRVTAACAIDALSHGLEGCVADVKVSEQDEWKSRECVHLVLESLPKVLETPDDPSLRLLLCRAAHYGGNAINKQLAGYVHAFAHSIGAYYHVPHGVAIAACLMPVMERQKGACTDRLAAAARHCGLAADTDADAVAADSLLQAVSNLVEQCGLSIGNVSVADGDIDRLTRLVARDSINYSAPVTLKNKEIKEILCHILPSR